MGFGGLQFARERAVEWLPPRHVRVERAFHELGVAQLAAVDAFLIELLLQLQQLAHIQMVFSDFVRLVVSIFLIRLVLLGRLATFLFNHHPCRHFHFSGSFLACYTFAIWSTSKR